MRKTTIAALTVASLLFSGCGDDSDDPETAPSSTPTATSSPEPSEPTGTEPTVEPATGRLINLERIKMRTPESWSEIHSPATFIVLAGDPKTFSNVSLSDLSAVGDTPLRAQAKAAVKSYPRARILEPVEIAGADWYHFAGRDDQYSTIEQFGTIYNDSMAVIEFRHDDKTPKPEQQEIVESVLASVEWK